MNELVIELGGAEGQKITLSYSDGEHDVVFVEKSLFADGRAGMILESIADETTYAALLDVSEQDDSVDAVPLYRSSNLIKALSENALPSAPTKQPERVVIDLETSPC